MVSTDGSRDDEEREEGSPEESVLPPGPRRSTYTPPVNPAATVPGPQAPEDEAAQGPESAPVAEPASVAETVAGPPPRDDLPAFVPPPPPAPDFDFLKPDSGPVNVIYQLDDVEPNVPSGISVETLAASPAGARILPKEPAPEPAPVVEPEREPIALGPVAVEPPPAEPALDSAAEDSAVEDSPVEDSAGESSAESLNDVDVDAAAAEVHDIVDVSDGEPAAEESIDNEPDERHDDEPTADAVGDDASGFVPFDSTNEPIAIPEFGDSAATAPPETVTPVDSPVEAAPVFVVDPVVTGEVITEPEADDAAGEPVVEAEPADPVETGDVADVDTATELQAEVQAEPVDYLQPTADASTDEEPADEASVEQPSFVDSRFEDEPRDRETFAEPDYDAVYAEPAYEEADAEPAYEEPGAEERTAQAPDFEEPAYEEPAFEDATFADVVDPQPTTDESLPEVAVESAPASPPAPDHFWSDENARESVEPAPAPAAESTADVTTDSTPVAGSDPAPEAGQEAPLAAGLTEAEQLAALSQQGAPAGRPWVPERRSLKDAELSSLLTGAIDLPNGTLGVMEELERQLQLRDEETREFQEWQESMLAVGTPEAIAAVEKVLPDFTDIVPPGTAVAIAAAASAAPTPTPPFPAAPIGDIPPPPSVAPSVSSPPPPAGVPTSSTPPPPFPTGPVATSEDQSDFEESAERRPVFEESLTPDELDAVNAAPPPLVEPPAPSMPSDWAFDTDADTIVPEPADAGPESEDEPSDRADPVELIPPAPVASKYAPTPPSEAPIFIEPVPVESDAPTLVEPGTFGGIFVDPVYTGPMTGSVSIATGGLSIPPEDLDRDIDDPLDEIDQAGFDQVFGSNPGTAPVLVTRVPEDEVVLGEPELHRPRIFSLEAAGMEPTPEDQRVGRAARMFWLWFAANASIASLAFGGVLFSLGLSLRQAIVAVLAGVAVSFLPLGLGTLAGKRSGQPTMVVSRAAFGLKGNALPAAIAVISRVFWGSALLWILGQGVAAVLDGAGWSGGIGRDLIAYLVMAAGLLIALAFAAFGYGLIVVLQLVSSIASAVLIVGVIVFTWQYVDVGVALTHPDGPWMLAGTAAVLVFSFIGLLWANSSGDLARYQRPGSSTPGSMLSTAFGATIPTFVLISYGALLAASNTEIAAGLVSDPFPTIGSLLPGWYPAPLIAAIVLGLLSAVVISIYSGGFALTAVGVRLSRLLSVVVIGGLIAVGAVVLMLIGTDYTMLFRDLATTLAVPVAAWAGIFAADAMIRQRNYDTEALLARGGIYPAVSWVNLSSLIVIIAIGFGLTTANVAGLAWQGYLYPLLGLPIDGAVAGTDLGVIVALVLGLLVPIVAGIPTIRKQEASPRRTG